MPNLNLKFKQTLLDPKKMLRVHLFVAVGVFIIFGIFGFRPSYKALQEKNIQITELEEKESALKLKSVELLKAKESLDAVEEIVPVFYRYMPDDVDETNYMMDFVSAVNRAAFTLLKFNIAHGQADSTTIDVELWGSPVDMYQVVKNVEELPRLTKVEKAESLFRNVRPGAKLTVIIYHTDYETLDFTQPFNDRIDTGFLTQEFLAAYE
jgi:Tfp pilus assembly protein PilO